MTTSSIASPTRSPGLEPPQRRPEGSWPKVPRVSVSRATRALIAALAVIGLLLAGSGAAAARAPARPRPVDARLSAAFLMHGVVRTAVRVLGEHRGQRFTRTWTFTGTGCIRNRCRQLLLTRQRSANLFDHLVLFRVGTGRYAGSGRFYAPLECLGAIYPQGQAVRYRVTVTITRATTVQGIRFATGLTATYTNARRIDRTICPTGPSHDAATYTGLASPRPSPPVAAFTAALVPGSATATFTSRSVPGGDRSPIASVLWQFGDPRSGPANTAITPQANHTFTAPGTYTVSLTVTDATGLRATHRQQVSVAGPPTP